MAEVTTQAANAQGVPPGTPGPDIANVLLGVGAPSAALPLSGTENMYVIQNGTLCLVPSSEFPSAQQKTVTVSGTATAIVATGLGSVVVKGNPAGGTTTIDINGGYVGQILRVDHIQGATVESVVLGTTVKIGSTGSFTATATIGIRDCLVFENLDGTHWGLHAFSTGFTV